MYSSEKGMVGMREYLCILLGMWIVVIPLGNGGGSCLGVTKELTLIDLAERWWESKEIRVIVKRLNDSPCLYIWKFTFSPFLTLINDLNFQLPSSVSHSWIYDAVEFMMILHVNSFMNCFSNSR